MVTGRSNCCIYPLINEFSENLGARKSSLRPFIRFTISQYSESRAKTQPERITTTSSWKYFTSIYSTWYQLSPKSTSSSVFPQTLDTMYIMNSAYFTCPWGQKMNPNFNLQRNLLIPRCSKNERGNDRYEKVNISKPLVMTVALWTPNV